MKKTLTAIFVFLVFLPYMVLAQPNKQYCYIKTIATADHPAMRLGQVLIWLKADGTPLTTSDDGMFSFFIPKGKNTFSISKVTKDNYELFEPLPKSFNAGPDPVPIRMRSKSEKRATEKRLRENAEKEMKKYYDKKTAPLKNKIAHLEKELTTQGNKNTALENEIKELRQEVAALKSQYDNRQELIDNRVKEYLQLDFSTLDDTKKKLYSFIEKGQYDQADSLLNSMDDKNFDQHRKSMQNNIKMMEQNRKTYLRGRFDLAIPRFEFKAAAKYISELADLDTTDINNVFDCALFLNNQNDLKGAERYYLIFKSNFEALTHDKVKFNDAMNYSQVMILLSSIYRMVGKYEKALLYLNTAIRNYKSLEEEYPDEILIYWGYADAHRKLAALNNSLGNYDAAEKDYNDAIHIYEVFASMAPDMAYDEIAEVWNSLALVYRNKMDTVNTRNYYTKAIKYYRSKLSTNTENVKAELATNLNDLAIFYCDRKDYTNALPLANEAFSLYDKLATENHARYDMDWARTHITLCNIYVYSGQTDKAMPHAQAALKVFQNSSQNDPDAYTRYYATALENVGTVLMYEKKYNEAIPYFQETVNIDKKLIERNYLLYDNYLINALYFLATLQAQVKDYYNAAYNFIDLLELINNANEQMKDELRHTEISVKGNLSYILLYCKQYAMAEKYGREALKMDPSQTWINTNLVSAMLFQGRYSEAEQLALSIKDEPDVNHGTYRQGIIDDLSALKEANAIPENYASDVSKLIIKLGF